MPQGESQNESQHQSKIQPQANPLTDSQHGPQVEYRVRLGSLLQQETGSAKVTAASSQPNSSC